jgi:hypothetical protein
MAKPTEQQVKELETALTEQFLLLVQGATFRINLARKLGLKDKIYLDYNNKFHQLVNKWILREIPYEKELMKNGAKPGLISSGNLKYDDFFYSENLPRLYKVANNIYANMK